MLRCVVLCNLCCIEVLVRFQDDLWKESLNVLKLAVASSSQLEVPTRKTLSVAYDSTWSLDTTPVRQELPGKTLSFSFDLRCSGISTENSIRNDRMETSSVISGKDL